MNPVIERIRNMFREMPLYRRIALGVIVLVVLAGFTTMFIWANKTRFEPAYSSLSREDAGAIVQKLKESNTPYRLSGDGTTILVPKDKVYDVRLTMAREGIPKGGGIGYEIFDKTEFGTTEFVQKINKKRAIQGELARTISAFDEVKSARVMIVMPEESVFVEETKEPSASILLELSDELEEDKVAAVAHLVASSIQDLTPKLVTVVDTAGRILFEGKSEAEKARIKAENLADSQYKYKVRYEENLARRIQSMLERIVGKDRAIVRVTSEMDFSKKNVNEEIYDPFERETEFVRSRKQKSEKVTKEGPDNEPSTVNPVVPPGERQGGEGKEIVSKNADTVNYEISKRVRQSEKPMAVIERLSVAAVVDGKYEYQTNEQGNSEKVYVPRSQEEMQQFRDIVVKAMGFNEIRQDQVSVETFPFAKIAEMEKPGKKAEGWQQVQKEYGRTIANVLLVILLFLFIIRPIIKTVRDIRESAEGEGLSRPEDMELLEEEKEPKFEQMTAEQQKNYLESMTEQERNEFVSSLTADQKAAYLANMSLSEKAAYYAEQDFNKTVNILRGWLSELEEEEAS